MLQKHSFAIRELALALETLDRFMQRELLRRTLECVLGGLA
ncbi:MAG: hypothetical protein AB8H47_07040 [Bacteroidia bacterium]